jgi:hypothetical protein
MIKLLIAISAKGFQFRNLIVPKGTSTISFLFKPSYIYILFFGISHNYIIGFIETLGKKFSVVYFNIIFSGISKRDNPFFIRNSIFFITARNNFAVPLFMMFQLIEQCSYFQIYLYSLSKLIQFCKNRWIKNGRLRRTTERFIRTPELMISDCKRPALIVVNFFLEKVGRMLKETQTSVL